MVNIAVSCLTFEFQPAFEKIFSDCRQEDEGYAYQLCDRAEPGPWAY